MFNQVLIQDADEMPFIPHQDDKPDAPKPIFTSYKVYKIRHKKTGLFSDGSYHVYWRDKGKEWKTLAPLGTHLAYACNGGFYGHKWQGNQDKIEDIEIVCYNRNITTMEYKAESGVEYVKGVMDRKNKRLAAEAKKKAKYKLAQAEKELKQAQDKLNQLKG